MGIGFLQGGGGVYLLSVSVFNFLAGWKVAEIIVDFSEVADTEVIPNAVFSCLLNFLCIFQYLIVTVTVTLEGGEI